ncbi:hypothetical protein HNO92_000824 [Chromobacterium alkanivorans]|uniref:hypothetical protein n=1 Tax=Chromobacterium alkanivorans TaxID=1071719 RepID=UPI00216915E7|nr:hypothetical protein [Chromobacterium alkanivorans]MCS3803164.1 hypothetical protein [Chromobacterium alkanivorans]MCS3817726.1 hypothetical protein [Chromobacterium alkanivorans]MCS3872530.1 hypothetical protein [Chromobacterium alkanivorans]
MSASKPVRRALPARSIPDYLPDEDAAPLALRRYILESRFPARPGQAEATFGWRASLRAWWRRLSARR